MKRIFFLSVLFMICLSALPLFAQDATPTVQPTGETTGETPASASTLTPQEILAIANKADQAAISANNNASNVVNNANNAVNTVNLILNFVQAASLFGGVLASIFAILGTRLGQRTLADYRKELDKAYTELKELRTGLDAETEQVRTQADRSIRALALMQLGEQQLERRNIRGSIQMYKQAFELDPNNRATNYFLGELYIQNKQLMEGIDHLQRALADNYDFAPAEAALGYALRLQAEQSNDQVEKDQLYADAEVRFIKALNLDYAALDINGESVQAGLGALYKRQGRMDKAIARYEEARKVTPEKSYPVGNLANLYFMQGKTDKANEAFQQSLRMSKMTLENNPQDYWARLDRMTAYIALEDYDKAKEDLDIILQQVNTPSPLETNINELRRLQSAPHPPQRAEEFIQQETEAIKRIKARAS